MTPEREKVFNFTHPFYTTGLSIAVSSQGKKNWQKAVERFFSPQFLRVIAGLALLLLLKPKKKPQRNASCPPYSTDSTFSPYMFRPCVKE